MKRYNIYSELNFPFADPSPSGDWCKWEDVEDQLTAMQTNLNDACGALEDCGFDITGKTIAQSIQMLKLMNKDLAIQIVDRGNSYTMLEAELSRYRKALERIANCGFNNSAIGYYTCQDIAKVALEEK